MSRPQDDQPKIEELLAVFEAAQSGALMPEKDQTPDLGAVEPVLSHDALVEEAKAIEAAWLASRSQRTDAAEGFETVEVVLSHEAIVEEARAIESSWLEARARVEASAVADRLEAEVESLPVEITDDPLPLHASEDSNDPEPSEVATGDGGRWLRRAWTLGSWGGVSIVAVLVIAISAAIVVPKAMGWTGMVVLSGSMEPSLNVGGLAFMEPVDSAGLETIDAGDIITYRVEGLNTFISHRVVEVVDSADGRSFVTRGDANDTVDANAIAADRVVGVVQFDVPYIGRVVNKLQDRSTYYIFVGIPAAMLILTELWSVSREVATYYRGKGRRAEARS